MGKWINISDATWDRRDRKAHYRVEHSKKLAPYQEIIWSDWPNWDQHLYWLCTASIAEIISWACGIKTVLDENKE